ncbi:MAG: hypothetical protein HY540_03050 [Deltaproteobacteria bacterium]|nr:hypothetical protein [Deltaproteobacteria bacterium]
MIGIVGFLWLIPLFAGIAAAASVGSTVVSVVQANKAEDKQEEAQAKDAKNAEEFKNAQTYKANQQAATTLMEAGSMAMVDLAHANDAKNETKALRRKGSHLVPNGREAYDVGRPVG